jgi:hypothetical protein
MYEYSKNAQSAIPGPVFPHKIENIPLPAPILIPAEDTVDTPAKTTITDDDFNRMPPPDLADPPRASSGPGTKVSIADPEMTYNMKRDPVKSKKSESESSKSKKSKPTESTKPENVKFKHISLVDIPVDQAIPRFFQWSTEKPRITMALVVVATLAILELISD